MTLASDVPVWLARLAAFVFGAIWGSFFNVAIHRWPHGMSVVSPPSHCPACGTRIAARHNIPLVSWLLLRGRAACCGAPIPPRYALVELLSAVLCTALAELHIVGAPPGQELSTALFETLVYFVFAGGLIVVTFVDLEWMEIPDEVSVPGAAFGLATAPMRAHPGADDAALGAGGGFLVVQLLFVWTYERLTGRRGMGEGDAKLLMMIGAFVGWRGALFALIAGAVQGVVVAIGAIVTGRPTAPAGSADSVTTEEALQAQQREAAHPQGSEGDESASEHGDREEADEAEDRSPMKIPFGPFLALGALEFLFFGEWLLQRYFALFDF